MVAGVELPPWSGFAETADRVQRTRTRHNLSAKDVPNEVGGDRYRS